MKKVLLVATVQSHIGQFHKPLMKLLKENGWEITTHDGLPSAQWEIMVLVTEDGHEVLCY